MSAAEATPDPSANVIRSEAQLRALIGEPAETTRAKISRVGNAAIRERNFASIGARTNAA